MPRKGFDDDRQAIIAEFSLAVGRHCSLVSPSARAGRGEGMRRAFVCHSEVVRPAAGSE